MFGITYAVLVGGFPHRRGGALAGTVMGMVYGLALGTGFLLSPCRTRSGRGSSARTSGRNSRSPYLAHAGFGALVGWLVHRFGRRIEPLWTAPCSLLPARTRQRQAVRQDR